MSFAFRIYKISDDPRSMNKNVIISGAEMNHITTGNVDFKKEAFNRIDPVIEWRPTNNTIYTQIRDANYMYSNTLGCYYFIKRLTITPTNNIRFELHLDVLMSYKNQLKALTVTLDRSETIFNGYVPDGEYIAKGYRKMIMKTFDKGLYNDNYILITTG